MIISLFLALLVIISLFEVEATISCKNGGGVSMCRRGAPRPLPVRSGRKEAPISTMKTNGDRPLSTQNQQDFNKASPTRIVHSAPLLNHDLDSNYIDKSHSIVKDYPSHIEWKLRGMFATGSLGSIMLRRAILQNSADQFASLIAQGARDDNDHSVLKVLLEIIQEKERESQGSLTYMKKHKELDTFLNLLLKSSDSTAAGLVKLAFKYPSHAIFQFLLMSDARNLIGKEFVIVLFSNFKRAVMEEAFQMAPFTHYSKSFIYANTLFYFTNKIEYLLAREEIEALVGEYVEVCVRRLRQRTLITAEHWAEAAYLVTLEMRSRLLS